jgi:hypothetical protein
MGEQRLAGDPVAHGDAPDGCDLVVGLAGFDDGVDGDAGPGLVVARRMTVQTSSAG